MSKSVRSTILILICASWVWAADWSLSTSKISASCRVKDRSVTKVFKITSTGNTDLEITGPPVDWVRVSPSNVYWNDNKKHIAEVKVTFFANQHYVNPETWNATIRILDKMTKQKQTIICSFKCTY